VLVARPLLFASLEPAVAGAPGVPVRALGLGFLALVGGTAAEATQVVGALLILGLLAGPAGVAVRVTDRPLRGLAVSALVAVGSVEVGLAVAYLVPVLPPSFAILAVVALAGVVAYLAGGRAGGRAGGNAGGNGGGRVGGKGGGGGWRVPGEPGRAALAYTRSMASDCQHVR
jgi:zinc/manganese transport system permease protein